MFWNMLLGLCKWLFASSAILLQAATWLSWVLIIPLITQRVLSPLLYIINFNQLFRSFVGRNSGYLWLSRIMVAIICLLFYSRSQFIFASCCCSNFISPSCSRCSRVYQGRGMRSPAQNNLFMFAFKVFFFFFRWGGGISRGALLLSYSLFCLCFYRTSSLSLLQTLYLLLYRINRPRFTCFLI